MLLIRKLVNSMANYRMGVKRRKRKARVGNGKSATVPAKSFDVKAAMQKAMPEKVVEVKPDSIPVRVATARLVNKMDLDEMLEASKVVEMGIKGEKIPAVKSSKAQRYAGTILRLNRKNDTKPLAEKMMHDLNVHIIKVNKKTTDEVESRRLYRELMREE